MRRFGIRLLSFCIRMASGKTIYDVTSGYRAGNRKVIAFCKALSDKLSRARIDCSLIKNAL